MRRLPIALALTAGVLALPAAAQAYDVGPGPDVLLTDTPHLTCAATCTLVQSRYANEETRVPSMSGTDRGVVVSYTVRGTGGKVRLRKLGVTGTTGTGGAATAWEDLSSTDGANQYVVSVPVKAGDALGIDVTGGSQVAYYEESIGLGADQLLGWEPALGNPQTRGADTNIEGYLGYVAEVEPDADGDGLGDETQDPCVDCHPTPGPDDPSGPSDPGPSDPGPSDPGPSNPGPKDTSDPYAEIRKAGPKVTIAGKAQLTKRVLNVTATNPYAFPVKGKLVLKQGKRTVAKGKLKLTANATKTVKLKVAKKIARRLKLTATLTGPVGKARTTTRKLTVSKTKPAKPGKGGNALDGVYHGSGATAGWTLVINHGVVENFNGRTSLYCTKAHKQMEVTFAMVGDDPDPTVVADGSFAWEATSGYGFQKLKFDGKASGGVARGKIVVEDRSPVPGADPVTGMPRIEFEYCFVGQEFELRK